MEGKLSIWGPQGIFLYGSCTIPDMSVLLNEHGRRDDRYLLELDFEPFNASFPRPSRSSSIGNGVQFLNRHLSSIMFRNKDSLEPLLDFLRAHRHKGHVRVPCRFWLLTKVDTLKFNVWVLYAFALSRLWCWMIGYKVYPGFSLRWLRPRNICLGFHRRLHSPNLIISKKPKVFVSN